MNDINTVADLYVGTAKRSLDSRKVTDKKAYRSEARGVLLSLEALVGMNAACLLIDDAVARAQDAIGVGHCRYGGDALLYDFWSLDRPKAAA